MAQPSAMKHALRRIDQAVRALAATNAWQPGDYRLHVWVNDADLAPGIHLLLEARSFPGATDFEKWDRVLTALETKLKDEPELRGMLHLVIQTFDQTAEGGLNAVGEQFVPIEELIAPAPTV